MQKSFLSRQRRVFWEGDCPSETERERVWGTHPQPRAVELAQAVLDPAVEAGPFAPAAQRDDVLLLLDEHGVALHERILVPEPGPHAAVVPRARPLEAFDLAGFDEQLVVLQELRPELFQDLAPRPLAVAAALPVVQRAVLQPLAVVVGAVELVEFVQFAFQGDDLGLQVQQHARVKIVERSVLAEAAFAGKKSCGPWISRWAFFHYRFR